MLQKWDLKSKLISTKVPKICYCVGYKVPIIIVLEKENTILLNGENGMKQVLQNTVYVNEHGEIIDQTAKMVTFGYRIGYTKYMRNCYLDSPHWFFCRVMDEAKIDKSTGCLAVDLTGLYNMFKNKKTFNKYMKEMEDENFVCRVGVHSYLLNPSYVHHGTQSSTENAIVQYNVVCESVTNNGTLAKTMRKQAAQERRIQRMKKKLGAVDEERSDGEKHALKDISE